MNVRFIGCFSLVFALLVATSSCESSKKSEAKTPEKMISAVDSRGDTIRLAHEAQRVVALYDPLVDDVFMLGAQEKLVGIPAQMYERPAAYTFFSNLSPQFKAKKIATPTFNGQSINIEKILSLTPDLVLTFNINTESITQLENLGIPVFTFSSEDDASILKELNNVGILLGRKKQAEKITTYVAKAVKEMRASKLETPKTVYYAWSRGRILSTSGKGSLIDMAIQLSGAHNACDIPFQAPNVSAETIYKWNPDLMILWNSMPSSVYELEELAALPAVKNRQVYVMTPAFPYDPHTVKFLLFAKQLRHWCSPESYTELMLNQDIQQFFQLAYGRQLK